MSEEGSAAELHPNTYCDENQETLSNTERDLGAILLRLILQLPGLGMFPIMHRTYAVT